MTEKKYHKIYHDAILKTLFKAKRPLSTNQVAERLGISWGTAKERLRELENKGKVSFFNKGKKGYWKLE